MKPMANHGSATVREATPHETQTRTNTILNALKRRAQARLNDRSLDPQSRAILRYALETHDPWLAELVRRADAGEAIVDSADVDDTQQTYDETDEEKIEELMEIICRANVESGTRAAALLVLMATIENSPHPKALANTAKHVALTRCAELNVFGIVEAQIAVAESELFAGKLLTSR
jgi:hypothetical protein